MNGRRARELGVPFHGDTGPKNGLTDVPGVEVGQTTLWFDTERDGKPVSVRTGVTAVLPKGKRSRGSGVFAGCSVLNGCGEMTGTHWLEESGFLYGPVVTTNTYSVGTARDAVVRWASTLDFETGGLPVVAETWDGYLNDIEGFHVKQEHIFHALDSAHGGLVEEGCVGGGTGMICYGFKAGIGTSSRVVKVEETDVKEYTVGVLVQANQGRREQLTVAGVPVGRELSSGLVHSDSGSIIVVVATDAPLLPHQLKRLSRRVSLGLARTGSISANSSGDIFIAFSTAFEEPAAKGLYSNVSFISNSSINPLFEAVVDATEEAIVNSLVAAKTTSGNKGRTVEELPKATLVELLRKHGRLNS
ncbi:MAG: P1 family peptidase [Thermoprotei archaeon]